MSRLPRSLCVFLRSVGRPLYWMGPVVPSPPLLMLPVCTGMALEGTFHGWKRVLRTLVMRSASTALWFSP